MRNWLNAKMVVPRWEYILWKITTVLWFIAGVLLMWDRFA